MLRITRYALEVSLELPPAYLPLQAPGALHVVAEVQVENRGAEPVRELPLLFYRLYSVLSATVAGHPAHVVQRLSGLAGLDRHQVNAAVVRLPEPLAPGAAARRSPQPWNSAS